MHRRHLSVLARKLIERLLESRGGKGGQFAALDHRGFAIGAGRTLAEPYGEAVGFVGVEHLRAEFGRLTEADRQHPGGQRIERTGVSRLARIEEPLAARHRARGAHPERLVEQQNAVNVRRHQVLPSRLFTESINWVKRTPCSIEVSSAKVKVGV
jgi:hypothetical protein